MGLCSETFLEETSSGLLCESICTSEASDSRHGNAGVIWATEHVAVFLYVDVIYMVHVHVSVSRLSASLYDDYMYVDHTHRKPNACKLKCDCCLLSFSNFLHTCTVEANTIRLIIKFRCYEAKIEESEKAGSRWELNQGHLWLPVLYH